MPQSKKILIIDDEPDSRVVLSKRLMTSGFQVVGAMDGPSGLEMAKRERPDLVILDIMMPGQDGVETYRLFRGDPQMQGIPIIFLTALASGGSVGEQSLGLAAKGKAGVELKNYSIVGKPYEPGRLLQQISKMLGTVEASSHESGSIDSHL